LKEKEKNEFLKLFPADLNYYTSFLRKNYHSMEDFKKDEKKKIMDRLQR